MAIINAHYDVAAAILEKGADPNVPDSTGTTALYALVDMHTLAPMQGRPAPKLVDALDAEALAKLLVARGANPNARLQRPTLGRYHGSGDASLGEGTTPFLRAAKAVDLSMMRTLLALGADPTMTKKDRTNAAMLVAAGQVFNLGPATGPAVTRQTTIDALRLCSRERRGHQRVQHHRADRAAHRGGARPRRGGEVPGRERREVELARTSRGARRSTSRSASARAWRRGTTRVARTRAPRRCCDN